MKFPSLDYLIDHGSTAFRKYPITVLSAAVSVVVGIYLVEMDGESPHFFPLINTLLCGYLGVPLFVAVRTYVDANPRDTTFLWLARLGVLVVLLLVFWYLPDSEDTLNKSISYIRYTIFTVAAHLLVSFAPYIQSNSINGFWNYNKSLFLRFLLSVLYSGFFYVGIVLALLAIDNLFDVEMDDELYFQIFIFMAGVFNTWFFVAGIPNQISALDQDREYPNGLRIFILYVLIPLLALYFVILYSYSGKIMMLWDWPSGIISYMIIAVAVLGILAMLLAYPYSRQEQKSPITFLLRGYYWILIPMIVMLYFAIGIRVNDYGITINRYITILLAVWLTLVALYMIAVGTNIKLIPISLFLMILITSFGPWGVFTVSESSQVNRLETILRNGGILTDKIQNEPIWTERDTTHLILENEYQNEGILSDSLHNEVMSILRYLGEYHGFRKVDSWFNMSPKVVADSVNSWEASTYMKFLGLRYENRSEQVRQYNHFYMDMNENYLKKISGYDYSLRINYYDYQTVQNKQHRDFDELPGVRILPESNTLTVKKDTTISFDIKGLYQTLVSEHGDPYEEVAPEKALLMIENDWIKAKFQLHSINGMDTISHYEGELFFTLKRLN